MAYVDVKQYYVEVESQYLSLLEVQKEYDRLYKEEKITEEQFNQNRQLFVEEDKYEDILEKCENDLYQFQQISELLAKINFDYDFEDKFYSNKNSLQTRIDHLQERIDQIKESIKNISPKLKPDAWRK